MYARMWEDDRFAKCKREEMEAALQIERNREALKVLFFDIFICMYIHMYVCMYVCCMYVYNYLCI